MLRVSIWAFGSGQERWGRLGFTGDCFAAFGCGVGWCERAGFVEDSGVGAIVERFWNSELGLWI